MLPTRSSNNSRSAELFKSVVVKEEPRPKNLVNDQPVPLDNSGAEGSKNPVATGSPVLTSCLFSHLTCHLRAGVEPPVVPAGPGKGTEFGSIPKPIPVSGRVASPVTDPVTGFLPCKRREPHDNFDPKPSKAAAPSEPVSNFDSFNTAMKEMSSAYDKERQKMKNKHEADLISRDANHALHIEKLKAEHADELLRLRSECEEGKQKYAGIVKRYDELKMRHAKELEQNHQSFSHQINAVKASTEAGYIKQIEQLTKNFEAEKQMLQIQIERRNAEIETTNRWRREDLRKVEQQLDDRQTKLNAQLVSHNELAVAQLTKTFDKRVEAVQAQCESDYRIKLAEQKGEYDRRIAELEAQLAAKHQDVELCNELRKSNELMPQLLDGISYATPQLVGFKNNVAEIVARAQDMNDHANRLQGFMTGWQMGMPRGPPMQPAVFFPSVPPQPQPPHHGSSGRVRHGAFHTESGPHHGQP